MHACAAEVVQTGSATANAGQWFEFNDSNIRPFDTKDLDAECFGGESSVTETNWGIDSVSTTQRIKNAYMLCYI